MIEKKKLFKSLSTFIRLTADVSGNLLNVLLVQLEIVVFKKLEILQAYLIVIDYFWIILETFVYIFTSQL